MDCVLQKTNLITSIVLENAVPPSRGVKSAKCLWVPTAQLTPVGEYLSASILLLGEGIEVPYDDQWC